MNIRRILGIALIAIGITLIVTAQHAKDTMRETLENEFTGTYSNDTKTRLIGGVILLVAGFGLVMYRLARK